MTRREYIVGTGYHGRPNRGLEWFWKLWLDNTKRYAAPREVIVLASGGVYPDLTTDEPPSNWIYLSGDLGHCGQLLSGEKPYRFGGWAGGMMTLAMLAYMNECDYVLKEQDTLAFGSWVEQMYAEIGSHGVIFGNCGTLMPAAMSIMLVKHEFIPDFVRLYISTAPERTADEMPECKFVRFERERPDLFCRFSFGYDRARPFNVKDKVWYAQKLTVKELEFIETSGLLPYDIMDQMPQREGAFTNG